MTLSYHSGLLEQAEALRSDPVLIQRTKAVLRKQMRAVRNHMPAAQHLSHSASISEALASLAQKLAEPEKQLRWLAYHSIKGEPDLSLFLSFMWSQAHDFELGTTALSLPSTEKAQHLTMHPWHKEDTLVERGHGFLEAVNREPWSLESVHAVILPALALGENGHRLGYGKGYYDQLLAQAPQALRIGVAFDFQLLIEMPHAPHDIPMDVIVTEKRVLSISGRA